MTCSGSFKRRLLRAALAGAAGLALAAGCGGTTTTKQDGPRADGGDASRPPTITASVPSLTFPATEIGKMSTAMSVTIGNGGGGMAGPLTVTASGDFTATGCSNMTLTTTTCTVMVIFAPTAQGPRTGMLTVSATGL